jgi:hypothetical protein
MLGALADQLERLVVEPALLPAPRVGIGLVKSMVQEMDELVGFYRSVVEGRSVPTDAAPESTSVDLPVSLSVARHSTFTSGSYAVPDESKRGLSIDQQ